LARIFVVNLGEVCAAFLNFVYSGGIRNTENRREDAKNHRGKAVFLKTLCEPLRNLCETLRRFFLDSCIITFILLVGCGGEAAVSNLTPSATMEPTMTKPATKTATDIACAPNEERPLRYLALGDSYTIGESVAEAERWPVQLVAALRQQGVNIDDADIVARTGWTTADLQNGITVAEPQGPYDLVSLLIGVNNQYRGLSQAEYRDELIGLLQTAVALAGGNPERVFVVSIPDWGATPFAQGRDRAEVGAAIDTFNSINREESARRGLLYIDITDISRRAMADESLTANDGLHPSGKMYGLWVARMKTAVCGIIG
jgi:lysophospholipase L1-like esterase